MEVLLHTEAGYNLVRLRGPAAAQLATLSEAFRKYFSWSVKESITRRALVGQSVSIRNNAQGKFTPCDSVLEYCWSSDASQQGLLTLLANHADPNQSWQLEHSARMNFAPQRVYAEIFGNRPLHAAVTKHTSIPMCEALIYHRADIHAEELSGLNALEFLVKRVHGLRHPKRHDMLQMAEFLCKEGVVLNRSDVVLTHVWERDLDAVRLLLEARASANDCRSFRYSSPLFLAAGKVGDVELTRLFLEHKADPAVQNLAGETAAEVATKEGFSEAAAVISTWLCQHPEPAVADIQKGYPVPPMVAI